MRRYSVIEECGVLSEKKNGDSIKLRYLSWDNKEPRYDLRLWTVDKNGNESYSKGIFLTGDELEALGKIILDMMER